jgi:hypothetical protein
MSAFRGERQVRFVPEANSCIAAIETMMRWAMTNGRATLLTNMIVKAEAPAKSKTPATSVPTFSSQQ